MREFRPMPTAPKAMRHIGQGDKRGDQEASQSVSFSQTVSLVSDRLAFAENGESSPYPRHSQVIKRRAPRRAKRMRHIEKKRNVFLRSEKSLKPSHSANMREFRPMPTTPTAMRHFGQADKRGSRRASQTVSFSQIVSLVSNRLTSPENGEWAPYPRHADGDLPPLPSWERAGVRVIRRNKLI